MNPTLHCAQTSEGLIAYCKAGRGPAIVQLPLMPFSHIEKR